MWVVKKFFHKHGTTNGILFAYRDNPELYMVFNMAAFCREFDVNYRKMISSHSSYFPIHVYTRNNMYEVRRGASRTGRHIKWSLDAANVKTPSFIHLNPVVEQKTKKTRKTKHKKHHLDDSLFDF